MTRPWSVIDARETADGVLELRRRGDDDFLITVAGRVLMNSRASRSEEALARRGVEALGPCEAPRVLVGGLGMGLTLRAALDALPAEARVDVAELHPVIVDWCRGPLAELNGRALEDERVGVEVVDVRERIAQGPPGGGRWDAILLDLFEGPHAGTRDSHPLWGDRALSAARAALVPAGVLAIWSEERSPAFEKRLARAGFRVASERPGRGGRRHAVILARAGSDPAP